ncbi:hypothetical protein rerp_59960 [Rhodococcus erythropolis]|nr:hypothetical protein rerp_59960 [Rhodococcus erythropolis]
MSEKLGHPVDFPIDVVSVTGVGAFNGGTAFGVRRWSQLWLLIYFGLHVHSLSAEEREALATDPLAFRDAFAAVPAPNEPVQRAAVRYLAFPKFFRAIVNAGHRRLIRDTFASYLQRSVSDDVDVDLDEIIRAFEAEQNGPVDFYQEPWKSMWKPVKPLKKVDATDDDVDEVEGSDDELLVPTTEFSIVDPDQELAEALHVDLGWLAGCTDLLRDRPQLIFYGPSGTGKTYIAKDVGSASRRPGQRHHRAIPPCLQLRGFLRRLPADPAQRWAGRLRTQTGSDAPLDRSRP